MVPRVSVGPISSGNTRSPRKKRDSSGSRSLIIHLLARLDKHSGRQCHGQLFSLCGSLRNHSIRPQVVQARVVADLLAQSRFRNVNPAVLSWADPFSNRVSPQWGHCTVLPAEQYWPGPNDRPTACVPLLTDDQKPAIVSSPDTISLITSNHRLRAHAGPHLYEKTHEQAGLFNPTDVCRLEHSLFRILPGNQSSTGRLRWILRWRGSGSCSAGAGTGFCLRGPR